MIEPNKLKPFTKFCYTIGMIPSSYKQSLTYEEQLIWFCDYLENTVIPAINNNAEALTEVQNLFTELQSYVDNYFENLDVQEEINNKLDEMVTDGTLSNLITPLINTEISELTNSINQLIDNDELLQKNISENFMNKIRYKYNNIINKINLPDNDFNNSSFFKKFPIFFNGTNHYYTNFDIKSMKNESEHIIYVDYQNGNNNNTGYEENLPKKTLTSAIGNASSGDTIILKKGWYPRQALELAIGKSINIIGEDGVVLYFSDFVEFEVNETFNNVYQTKDFNYSNLARYVYDISLIKENIINELTKVNSIQEVSLNENSWFKDNDNVYVHLYNNKMPSYENILIDETLSASMINCSSFTEDANIYIENVTILNGGNGTIRVFNESNYRPTLILNNVKALINSGSTLDSVSIVGANFIGKDVICGYSKKDGFNYHNNNAYTNYNVPVNAIEINCSSFANGFGSSLPNNQGSTAHEDTKIIRLNCKYGLSKSANISDINNSKSLNFGIIALDGITTGTSATEDILLDNNAIAYLFGCKFKGSKSDYNLRTYSNTSHIYYDEFTEFDTILPIDDNITQFS